MCPRLLASPEWPHNAIRVIMMLGDGGNKSCAGCKIGPVMYILSDFSNCAFQDLGIFKVWFCFKIQNRLFFLPQSLKCTEVHIGYYKVFLFGN